MKPHQLRPFDVLKNTLNGELGLVLEIAENKVCLADRTGQKSIYKLGDTFIRVQGEGAFSLAVIAKMRELRKLAHPPKKRRAAPKKAVAKKR